MKRRLAILLCGLILSGSALSLGGCETASKYPENYDDLCGTKDVSSLVGRSDIETADSPDNGSPSDTSSKYVYALTPDNQITPEQHERVNDGINAFSAALFRKEYEDKSKGENSLMSPLSVYAALGMLLNGADSATKTELTDVLSGYFNPYMDGSVVCYGEYDPIETEVLNRYIFRYMYSLNADEVNNHLNMSNSVWVNNLNVRENYLNDVKYYYGAEIWNETFTDDTADKINSWVSDKTDGMIKDLLSRNNINDDMIAVLLNAISFEADWKNPYSDSDIYKSTFRNYDGSTSETDFMSSDETYYVDAGNALGFIKEYKGNGSIYYSNAECPGGPIEIDEPRFCFVALMPNENIGIDKYISEYFTDSTIKNSVNTAAPIQVTVNMPKFDFECTYNLKETLKTLGMELPFDREKADFPNFGATDNGENIYVGGVVHKTHITVDDKGTKAAAATAIDKFADSVESDTYEITLDRPFLFAIYDYYYELPVFIGVVNNL